MGFSRMLPSYEKLLDRAVCTVNSPAGDLLHIDKATDFIWQRLQSKKHARGYSRKLVRRIVTDQAKVPSGKPIPLSPELQAKLGALGKAAGRELKRKGMK